MSETAPVMMLSTIHAGHAQRSGYGLLASYVAGAEFIHAPRGEDNPRPLASKLTGGCLANPRRCPGHDHNFALWIHERLLCQYVTLRERSLRPKGLARPDGDAEWRPAPLNMIFVENYHITN